jgi:hypothetical protein
MIRTIIEVILVFLLPSAVYVSFALLGRSKGTSVTAILNRAPILALSLVGAALVMGAMAFFGNVGDGKPGQAYEPAVFENGKVTPGRMK